MPRVILEKNVQHPKLRLFAVESVERPRSSPMPLQVVVVHTLGRCRKQKPPCVSQTVLHRWLRMKSLKFRTNTNRYSNKLDVDFRKCCAVAWVHQSILLGPRLGSCQISSDSQSREMLLRKLEFEGWKFGNYMLNFRYAGRQKCSLIRFVGQKSQTF